MTLSYVASSLAPLELAAHQLVYSLWSLCSYATVPLEQVALAFVPVARGAYRCLWGFLHYITNNAANLLEKHVAASYSTVLSFGS